MVKVEEPDMVGQCSEVQPGFVMKGVQQCQRSGMTDWLVFGNCSIACSMLVG